MIGNIYRHENRYYEPIESLGYWNLYRVKVFISPSDTDITSYKELVPDVRSESYLSFSELRNMELVVDARE